MDIRKKYKLLVKNEIPKQKILSLARFYSKIFTTGQILKTKF